MKLRRREREGTWQAGLYLKLVVLLAVIAYAVAFVIENHRETEVHFVFHTTRVSLIWRRGCRERSCRPCGVAIQTLCRIWGRSRD